MKNKAIPCPNCEGHGYINGGSEFATWSRTCDRCHGTGTIMVPKTIADCIRSMTDEELAAYWFNHYDNFCQNKPECGDILDDDKRIPDHLCIACVLEWLRKPAEEPKLPNIFEDKQDSGLIEED